MTVDDRIIDYIATYRREHGYCPTIKEVAAHMGYASHTHVWRILQRLRDEGRVSYVDGEPRTLVESNTGAQPQPVE